MWNLCSTKCHTVLSQNLVEFLVWYKLCGTDFPICIFQACLVGIVVPDPDFLPMWIKKKGIEGSYSELCNNKVRFITITYSNLKPHLLCMLTFFWLFLGCEECHSGGHPEIGQRRRTQVFWAGAAMFDCPQSSDFFILLYVIWQHKSLNAKFVVMFCCNNFR